MEEGTTGRVVLKGGNQDSRLSWPCPVLHATAFLATSYLAHGSQRGRKRAQTLAWEHSRGGDCMGRKQRQVFRAQWWAQLWSSNSPRHHSLGFHPHFANEPVAILCSREHCEDGGWARGWVGVGGGEVEAGVGSWGGCLWSDCKESSSKVKISHLWRLKCHHLWFSPHSLAVPAPTPPTPAASHKTWLFSEEELLKPSTPCS